MGAFIPILASYLNIKIIDFISSKYDHQITAKFNAAQFFIKSIFVVSLMFIGIKELELNIPILTDIGIARNAILAYNCDVALAISGNYGTLSEIAHAFQLKKPVVGYKTWDINPIIKAKSPEDVMLIIKKEFMNV